MFSWSFLNKSPFCPKNPYFMAILSLRGHGRLTPMCMYDDEPRTYVHLMRSLKIQGFEACGVPTSSSCYCLQHGMV